MPKSAIFTRPFLSSRMFSGLMSRWTMPCVVGVLQRLADLRHDGERLGGRESPRLQHLPQRQAVHKFHQQKIISLRFAEVVNGDDVGMVQPGQRAGFAFESLGKLRVVLLFRRKDLQRHEPVQARLAGFVNRAHAALAQQFDDFELGK